MAKAPPAPPSVRESRADLDATLDAERQLREVERAMAVLEGKDPEKLRKLREARADAEKKFKEIADRVAARRARAAKEQAQRRTRIAVRIGIGVALLGVVAYAVRIGAARRARWSVVDGALDALAAPYVAHGMRALRPALATENRVEITVAPGECFVALGAAEGGVETKLRVEHGPDVIDGGRSVAWCSCGVEKVAVTAIAPRGPLVGVRLLGAAGGLLGGSEALPFLDPPPTAYGPPALECEAEHLDAWIDARRFPHAAVDGRWFDASPARKGLAALGATVVARVAPDRPFAVVDPSPASCFVAVSSAPADRLALRLPKGARPLGNVQGPIAWCSQAAVPVTVFREGAGEVTVLVVPSRRIGGMLGMREAARRAKLGDPAGWVPPGDLGEDASDVLRASGVVDPVIVWPKPSSGPARALDPRIVALSVAPGGSFVGDRKVGASFECAPTLAPSVAGQSLCVQSWPQTWRPIGVDGAGGAAEAPLPFWMSMYQGVDDPRGIAQEVALLALARRLTAAGFEPTVLEGVVELPKGIDVIGRVGEDAIVAIGMAPRAPWAFPYTDGDPWTLDAEPRVVELKPGEHALLTSSVANAIGEADRRTVVFRRPVRR